MIKAEKKILRALKDYYLYLSERLVYIRYDFIDVSDREFKRIIKTREIYKKFFNIAGFKTWLLKNNHPETGRPVSKADTEYQFFMLAQKMKNEILRSEEYGEK